VWYWLVYSFNRSFSPETLTSNDVGRADALILGVLIGIWVREAVLDEVEKWFPG